MQINVSHKTVRLQHNVRIDTGGCGFFMCIDSMRKYISINIICNSYRMPMRAIPELLLGPYHVQEIRYCLSRHVITSLLHAVCAG